MGYKTSTVRSRGTNGMRRALIFFTRCNSIAAVDPAAERGAAERQAVKFNKEWHAAHGNTTTFPQLEEPVFVPLPVAAQHAPRGSAMQHTLHDVTMQTDAALEHFARCPSGVVGGGGGVMCIKPLQGQKKFRINHSSIEPMHDMTVAQRETRITALEGKNFYTLDIGALGIRQSVIFKGAEISWAQLLRHVTFVHQPQHTYVVMSPDFDMINGMNDFGWSPSLCFIVPEAAAEAEYNRLAALRNHARLVEEVVATMDPHFNLPPAKIVGLVAVFFRDPPLNAEVGVTGGWGLWRLKYLRDRRDADDSASAAARSRIHDVPEATGGRDYTNRLTFEAANAVEPGWKAVYYSKGQEKPTEMFMNPNVPEYSAIRKRCSISYLNLAKRIFKQVSLGATGASGTEDIVQNFMRVQTKLRRNQDLAKARGGLNQISPRLRPPSSGRRNRPSQPVGEATKTYKVGAPERRQLLLDMANLLQPGWTLVEPLTRTQRWVFVNKRVPAYRYVKTGLSQSEMTDKVHSNKAKLMALPPGPDRELVSRYFTR